MAEQRTLGHNVDPTLAHCGDYLSIGYRGLHLDAQPLELIVVNAKSSFEIERPCPWRHRIPPCSHKTNAVQLRADPLNGGQQRIAYLPPTPPIMAHMHDVERLGCDAGGFHLGSRIVAIEQQRNHPWFARLQSWLEDLICQIIEGGEPRPSLSLA